MKTSRTLGLTGKLLWAFLIVGMIPLGVLAWVTVSASYGLTEGIGQSFTRAAGSITKMVDRNLFERYGDVQAFGANAVLKDKASWYQVGSAKNRIADTANTYANLYGIYLLSVVVDTEGRVIAVNDKNPQGKPIDTAGFYARNFKDASWFKETVSGHFLRSATLDGTYVEDVHFDEDVKKTCGGDGLVLTFSAPIKDENGNTIGIWHNAADFSVVEEIVADAYGALKAEGYAKAEITLLDGSGRVIVDFDPVSRGGKAEVNHDPETVLKLNLAEKGVEAARKLTRGQSGWDQSIHARKKIRQLCGFASSKGALGYPGLKWGTLVRVDEKEGLAEARAIRAKVYWVLGIGSVALLLVAAFLGRKIAAPILSRLRDLDEAGQQVSAASGQVAAASQALAEGASEQAASLEETSASLEEMTSMVKRNAEAAGKAKVIASETRTAAEAGTADMAELKAAMSEIKSSSSEVAKIVREIDEIAFQTNILALNAAVEAARAGEAGAGFAVVADEVRNLAQRSAMSARETATKIEAAIAKSEWGVQISGKVASSFESIATKTREVDQYVAEIATASKEQAQGVGQVNIAVTQMDKVTQSNAASAEESAAAAEELNSQAGTVKQSVQALQCLVGGVGRILKSVPSTHEAVPPKPGICPKQPAHRSRPGSLISTPSAAIGLPLSKDEAFKDF